MADTPEILKTGDYSLRANFSRNIPRLCAGPVDAAIAVAQESGFSLEKPSRPEPGSKSKQLRATGESWCAI